MAAITTPDLLPCPSALSLSAYDMRLSSDPAGRGPVELRAIEQDERQTQQLQFVCSPAQTQVFRQFWTETLVFGGAWFSAPASWPAIEGLGVVKVRRFTSAPQFASLGNGFTRITIDCEARGNTVLPNTPTPPEPPAPDIRIRLDTRAPAGMVFGAAYLADYGSAGTFDASTVGFQEVGSQAELIAGTLPEFHGVYDADNGLPTASARSTTHDIGTEYRVVEFHIDALPAGVTVAIGCYTRSLGPGGNLEDFLMQFSSISAYWMSNGRSNGYGQIEHDTIAYAAGDVLGMVFNGVDQECAIYLNGVQIEILDMADNNGIYFYASMRPF